MTHSDPAVPGNGGARPPPSGNRGSWPMGVLLAIACMAMVVPLAIIVATIADEFGMGGEAKMGLLFMPMILFGLSQWLFALPLGFYLRYRGKTDTAAGLWTTAGVVMLLNGACYGLMMGLSI